MTRQSARRGLGPAVALVAALACTHAPTRPGPGEQSPAPAARPQERGEVGLASFYGRRFHGRKTASGERYDMRGLTCAHPSAPFGARLRVTDLETGKSVVVTVTDRGPFRRGRIVDLSLAAARRLGMLERGVARVRVEALADGQDDEGVEEGAGAPAPRSSR
ncbi:MAG TPA: septal ring lytic transglycosylase RlpA family protein [Anaeromyxobacter sp.]|nr:septal ring lytic transglycosylase RlpA family protein [Anaeromyxobacter sp.]